MVILISQKLLNNMNLKKKKEIAKKLPKFKGKFENLTLKERRKIDNKINRQTKKEIKEGKIDVSSGGIYY